MNHANKNGMYNWVIELPNQEPVRVRAKSPRHAIKQIIKRAIDAELISGDYYAIWKMGYSGHVFLTTHATIRKVGKSE